MPRAFSSKTAEDDAMIVSFTLNASWKLPGFYEERSVEDVQKALELGAECVQSLDTITHGAANIAHTTAVAERAAKQLAEAERKAAYEMDILKKEKTILAIEVESLRAKCAGMTAAADERAETIRLTAALEAERKVTELKATVESLRTMLLEEGARRDADIARAVDARQSMIDYLKSETERRDRIVADLQEQLLAKSKVRANAVLKGKEGEEDFELAAADMGWGLVRTAKESHQCDYKGNVGGMDVFFEIKAHAETVPTKELSKFHRDMKEHPEIGAGVFIALHATLKKSAGGKPLWTEWTDDGRLMVFVGELMDGVMPLAGTLHVIGQLLEIAARIWHAKAEHDTGAALVLESRLRMGIKYLEGAAERLRVLYNKIVVDRKAATDAYDTTLGMVKMIREELAMTLGTLLGTHAFELCGDVTTTVDTNGAAVAANDSSAFSSNTVAANSIGSSGAAESPPKKKARTTKGAKATA